MKDEEREIILAIKQGTESASARKDEVWAKIQKRMEKENMQEKRSRRARIVWRSVAAVIIIGAVFIAATPSGRAAAGRFLDLFKQYKTIEQQLEGQTESGDYQLHTSGVTPAPENTDESNAVGYVIYVDESRYYTETEDGVDRILPKDYPEDLPPVYMEIRQDAARTPEEVAAELEAQLKEQYPDVTQPQEITEPVDAIMFRALSGSEWDSTIVRYYLIDNTVGGTFIVEERFFLEAEEGHGARFSTMLQQFQIVPAGE